MANGYSFHVSPPTSTPAPIQDEEFYSSWSLFLVCMLLILSLWTSYYLQIKRIRAIHETLVSVFAGMFVGMVVRLAPGTMIREMLVSAFILAIEREVDVSHMHACRRSSTPYSSTYYCRQSS